MDGGFTPAAPAYRAVLDRGMVPREFVGLARQFMRQVGQDGAAVQREMEEIYAAVREDVERPSRKTDRLRDTTCDLGSTEMVHAGRTPSFHCSFSRPNSPPRPGSPGFAPPHHDRRQNSGAGLGQ
jgi:hypothetical protein